jgi:hypothetical protein
MALKSHLERARGRRISVLMETDRQGRSPDFTPVRFHIDQSLEGALVDCVVSGDNGTAWFAEALR